MKYGKIVKLNMPDKPGVYVFRDAQRRPLYIGRATSLKTRVRSYFRTDAIESRGPRIVDMVTKARSVTWQEQDSVLEAVLLEAELIRKYQPYYNVDDRDDKSSQYVVITDELWPRVFLARARDLDQHIKEHSTPFKIKKLFGPFPDSGLIKEALKILRRLFPFRDKKSLDYKHEAFYRALGQSPEGTEESGRQNYIQTIRHLILFFQGRKGKLETELKSQMKAKAKELKFEEAEQSRRLLNAMKHINDIALIKREASAQFGKYDAFRMEAYDVAHLGGSNNVGVMTVSINGQMSPSEYRKFKISKNKNDDIAGLVEILSRRLNHTEWQYPNIIVVDGNKTQASAAESVLASRRICIPIIAVTKDERHKASGLIGDSKLAKQYRNEIVQINDEAHRFAVAYHRKRREGMHARVVQ